MKKVHKNNKLNQSPSIKSVYTDNGQFAVEKRTNREAPVRQLGAVSGARDHVTLRIVVRSN